MPDAAPGLFTIGHSNVVLGDFLGLLQQHGIEAAADVRTVPRSRWMPHFDAERLHDALARSGIDYVPLGRELGGRPAGDEFYDEQGHVLYGRLAASPAFQEGIGQVLAEGQTRRVALLCSEADPARCHRHLLIGRVLRERGVALSHIRGGGRIETEMDLTAREFSDVPQGTLFDSGTAERQWRSPRPVPRKRPRRAPRPAEQPAARPQSGPSGAAPA
jgi:uncharacterized protein (DUF488 family)